MAACKLTLLRDFALISGMGEPLTLATNAIIERKGAVTAHRHRRLRRHPRYPGHASWEPTL
jgi:hypothetical protein